MPHSEIQGELNNLWLHLACWNLPDCQLCWESKMEPECGNIGSSWFVSCWTLLSLCSALILGLLSSFQSQHNSCLILKAWVGRGRISIWFMFSWCGILYCGGVERVSCTMWEGCVSYSGNMWLLWCMVWRLAIGGWWLCRTLCISLPYLGYPRYPRRAIGEWWLCTILFSKFTQMKTTQNNMFQTLQSNCLPKINNLHNHIMF